MQIATTIAAVTPRRCCPGRKTNQIPIDAAPCALVVKSMMPASIHTYSTPSYADANLQPYTLITSYTSPLTASLIQKKIYSNKSVKNTRQEPRCTKS